MSVDSRFERGYGAGGYGEGGYGRLFSDELALQATASLNSTASEIQFHVWGTALDQITVSDLWTDWGVADYSAAGGAFTDDTAAEGTITLDWAEIAADVEPTVTFAVPERYVGGTYLFGLSASDGTDSISETVSIDLDI